MASIITSISLDERTMEIKNRCVGSHQFSRFVRACLTELDAQVSATHTQAEEARVNGVCNGLLKPACVLCWPDGAPSGEAWRKYRFGGGEIPSAEKQRIVKSTFTHDYAQKESKDAATSKATKGLLRRFIAWLI